MQGPSPLTTGIDLDQGMLLVLLTPLAGAEDLLQGPLVATSNAQIAVNGTRTTSDTTLTIRLSTIHSLVLQIPSSHSMTPIVELKASYLTQVKVRVLTQKLCSNSMLNSAT